MIIPRAPKGRLNKKSMVTMTRLLSILQEPRSDGQVDSLVLLYALYVEETYHSSF